MRKAVVADLSKAIRGVALELATLAKEFEASIKAPRIVARRE
jgi:hypothetical protein